MRNHGSAVWGCTMSSLLTICVFSLCGCVLLGGLGLALTAITRLHHIVRCLEALAQGRPMIIQEPTRLPGLATLESWVVRIAVRTALSTGRPAQESRGDEMREAMEMFAHDVRKPFALLKLALEELQECASLDDFKEFAKGATRETMSALERVEAMTRNILDAGSARAMRGVSSQALTAPGALERLVRSSVETAFQEARATLPISCSFRHISPLRVDLHRFERALRNVILNACEATRGRGAMWVRTRDVRVQERACVEIVVGNSGSSIPEDVLPRIFDPYYTHGKVGGTGLGLAFVARMADLHGGSVVARSHPIRGVEFVFTFPSAFRCTASGRMTPGAARAHGGA